MVFAIFRSTIQGLEKTGTNSMPLGGIVNKGKKDHGIGASNDRPNLPQGRPASNGWQEGQK
ncbi:hypothetical protein DSCW_16200 [Desulfosarcina widdelii]|uniref:Uncharacterized protein n=1 Tax=Desulfosarcina widdelii TaxID=947919 RepID=A0A5K7Z281_9BACT|nr:hypothetical protein DSCW_16200 [Desulfosarcina widdelii]